MSLYGTRPFRSSDSRDLVAMSIVRDTEVEALRARVQELEKAIADRATIDSQYIAALIDENQRLRDSLDDEEHSF